MTTWYALALGVLGVWRITHLLNAEDGPANILVRFRRTFGASGIGQLLDCFYCLSLWVAVPFALVLAGTWSHRVLLGLACSGGACVLERITHGQSETTAVYVEDELPGGNHAVLRKPEETIPDIADPFDTH